MTRSKRPWIIYFNISYSNPSACVGARKTYLKTGCLGSIGGTKVSFVSSSTITRFILVTNIRHLKDLDGQRQLFVGVQSLQDTGQKRGTNNLVFGSLGVGKLDSSFAIVSTVEEFEVFIVRALKTVA